LIGLEYLRGVGSETRGFHAVASQDSQPEGDGDDMVAVLPRKEAIQVLQSEDDMVVDNKEKRPNDEQKERQQ
jgi:hypothetical protein